MPDPESRGLPRAMHGAETEQKEDKARTSFRPPTVNFSDFVVNADVPIPNKKGPKV